MATTTNYGWTTPDDTNLVKNGAADIRTLANAIDSTVKSNDNAALKASIVDAKGDLLAGTAADMIARLAVGTNGQILTANSATSTGLEWTTPASGSLTQIGQVTFNGSSATGTISSIPGTYKRLMFVLTKVQGTGSSNTNLLLRFNGNNTSGSYRWANLGNESATVVSISQSWTAAQAQLGEGFLPGSSGPEGLNMVGFVENYASTSGENKGVTAVGFTLSGTIGRVTTHGSVFTPAAAITSMSIIGNSVNLASGTFTLYGVN